MGRPRKNPEFPPPPPETLGDRLRAARTRLGLTQVQLAQALGVADRAVQNYEQDRNAIRMSVLERLGRIGFDIQYLVYGNEHAELSASDQALWERVVDWANTNCVDEENRPLPEAAKYQRMTTLYRWLKGAQGDPAEVADRLQRMSASRAA